MIPEHKDFDPLIHLVFNVVSVRKYEDIDRYFTHVLRHIDEFTEDHNPVSELIEDAISSVPESESLVTEDALN